MTKTLLS